MGFTAVWFSSDALISSRSANRCTFTSCFATQLYPSSSMLYLTLGVLAVESAAWYQVQAKNNPGQNTHPFITASPPPLPYTPQHTFEK